MRGQAFFGDSRQRKTWHLRTQPAWVQCAIGQAESGRGGPTQWGANGEALKFLRPSLLCPFSVTWLKEILLTFPRQGVEWNKACREEGEERRRHAVGTGKPGTDRKTEPFSFFFPGAKAIYLFITSPSLAPVFPRESEAAPTKPFRYLNLTSQSP